MSSKNFYGLTGDVTIDGGILNVGNAQLYANTDTSNVGIGTTNPEFTLDVLVTRMSEFYTRRSYMVMGVTLKISSAANGKGHQGTLFIT